MQFSVFAPPPKLNMASKHELVAYFEWFVSIIPKRIEHLATIITEDAGFQSWQANYSRASLEKLEDWFVRQVEIRNRSQGEIDSISNNSKYPIEVPQVELSSRTFAVVHDVGIYLGEVFRAHYPSLRWKQVLGNKSNIYYGQASLDGFGKKVFCPIHLMIMFAYDVSEKKLERGMLNKLYETWSKFVEK